VYIFVCVVPVLGSVPPLLFSVGCVVPPCSGRSRWVFVSVCCLVRCSRLSCLRVACRSCACRSVGGVVACLGLPVASSFVSFLPASAGSVLLSGLPASALFPVAVVGVSGCVVSSAFWFSGSARSPVALAAPVPAGSVPSGASGLVAVLASGASLVCLSAAFPGGVGSPALASLGASVRSAVLSGAVVFPVVAASGLRPASGFFCGLAAVASPAAVGVALPGPGVSFL